MRVHLASINQGDPTLAVFRELACGRDEADPACADVILFVDAHADPDPLQTRLRRHPLTRRYRKRTFVYDQRDNPVYSLPGIYVSGTPGWARRHRLMTGGPYASSPSAQAERSALSPPDLLYTFVGSMTHPVRNAVMDLRDPRGTVRNTGDKTFWEMSADEQVSAAETMGDSLRRAKFVLCPRGFGASSYRLFETLALGRVPVVISDDWLPPSFVDWNSCVVRVRERDVPRIPRLLAARETEWSELVAAGTEVFNSSFSRSQLWPYYVACLNELIAGRRRWERPWWFDRRAARIGVSNLTR